MGINFAFKDDRKLQSMVLVSIATRIWETPIIQQQINAQFIKGNKFPKQQDWYKIIHDALNYFKQTTSAISFHLEEKIHNAIIGLGERIFYWIEYLTQQLHLDFTYARKIYFTRHGTIDEVKIFNMYWANNPELSKINGFNKGIFLLSCLFAQEEFVNQNKDVMIAQLKKTKKVPANAFKKYADKCYLLITATIIEYIQQFELSRKGKKLTQQFKNKTGDVIKTEEMYELCSAYGLYEASNYFFGKCSGVMFVVPMMNANACIREIESLKEINSYRKGKLTDTVIANLSIGARKDLNFFMQNHIGQCLQLLLIWPLEHFYFTFLEQVREYLPEKKSNMEKEFALLIKSITDFITEYNKVNLIVKTNLYRDILAKTWSVISDPVKSRILTKAGSLVNLFNDSDFKTLGLLIDIKNPPKDEESDEINMRYWKIGDKINEMLKEGNFGVLTKFLKEAFSSDEDREIFKQEIVLYFAMRIMSDGLIDQGAKILNWMSSSDENLIFWKNTLNQNRIVHILISKNDFQTIDKFFNFLSLSPEQIQEFKKRMLSDNENSVKEFLQNVTYGRAQSKLFHTSIQESLVNFFKFCGATPEKIIEIKNKIKETIYEWIRYFAIELPGMNTIHSLVHLAFDGEDEADEIIKNFLDSPDGLVLAQEMIDGIEYNPEDYVFTFINHWMPLARDRNDFKRRLIASSPNKKDKIERVFQAIEYGGLDFDDVEGNYYPSSDEIDKPEPKVTIPKMPFFLGDSNDDLSDLDDFMDMMGDVFF